MKTQRSPKPNSPFTKFVSDGLSWILAILGIVLIGFLARQFASDILVLFLILLSIAAVFISFLLIYLKTKIDKNSKTRLSDSLEEGNANCDIPPVPVGAYDDQWEEAYLRALTSQSLQSDLNKAILCNLPILNNTVSPARHYEVDRSLVVLLTPNTSSEDTLNSICKNACETVSLNLIQGNEGCVSENWFSQSIENLIRAAVILVNIDEKNPIVFYQLGIAHALGKNVICISRRTNNVQFDILQNRMLSYKDDSELAQLLQIALKQYSEYLDQEQRKTTPSTMVLPDEVALWRELNVYAAVNYHRELQEGFAKINVRRLKPSSKPLTYVLSKKASSNPARRTVSAVLNHIGEKIVMKNSVDL